MAAPSNLLFCKGLLTQAAFCHLFACGGTGRRTRGQQDIGIYVFDFSAGDRNIFNIYIALHIWTATHNLASVLVYEVLADVMILFM